MFGRIIDYDFDGKNHVILTDKNFKITFKIEGKYISYIRKYKGDVVYYDDRNGPEDSFINKKFESINIDQYVITPFNMISETFKTEFEYIYFELEGEDEDWVVFIYNPNFKTPEVEVKVELVS